MTSTIITSPQTTTVVDTVHSIQLNDTQRTELLRTWRPRLLAELHAASGVAAGWPPVTHPLEAFSILFGVRADSFIVNSIVDLYKTVAKVKATLQQQQQQWVYVFHDARDPPSVVKIGGTRLHNPQDRIAQWAQTLSAPGESRAPLTMLFAYPTYSYRLAESIVHTLLMEVRIPRRINRLSNRSLVEYFTVPDFVALAYLIKSVTRHVDYTLCATTKSNRKNVWIQV